MSTPQAEDDRPTTCPVLEMAHRLVGKVEGQKLPEDWEPEPGRADNKILAEIRHNHTNYEELLWELPVCVDLWDSDECPDNPYYWDKEKHREREGEECPLYQEAHDTLKWAAKTVAQAMYHD